MLNVHSVETFGTHDGPGIRMVVFLQGCHLRCVYCHNPDTQPLASQLSKSYSSEDILEMLEKQRAYFSNGGGLTVSGGEPTLQSKELIDLFKKAKARGFHVALDTNGALVSEDVKRLYDLTDLVILDIKHIDDKWHRLLTKASNVNVLKNAEYREKSGKPMRLRYVLVPGWTDQPEFMTQWAEYFQNYTTLERVEILPYHTFGAHKYAAMGLPNPLEGVEPPSDDTIHQAHTIFTKYLPNVVVA
jgi:pyruvate formate lyase activating enzyme